MKTKKTICLLILVVMLLAVTACGKTPVEEFDYSLKDGGVVIVGYNGSAREIRIPQEIEGRPVIAIDNFAFSGYDLTEIDIPDSVVKIKAYAFYQCEYLENIEIGDGLLELGNNAFTECKALKSISLPEGITSIWSETFFGCTSLESVDIPSSVTEISSNAFQNCTSLTKITIPDSVTYIGAAFGDCSNLAEVNLPDSLETLSQRSFSGCTSLKELVIPEKTELKLTVYDGGEVETPVGTYFTDRIPNTIMVVTESSKAHKQLMEVEQYGVVFRVNDK